ncbi:MAG: CDP-glycerol glycerophosphotransferase family protein [Cyclobacteriaceae bacterium]
MRVVLFCKNPYAFGIQKPLFNELVRRGHPVIWYVPKEIEDKFPYESEGDFTSSIKEIYDFKSDVIFVPGNEVPHYLRGVKTQIFHGLAGEKKGHFRIRKYFDLYLTQGPYFTDKFSKLSKKHKDFDVIETGWPKLDQLFKEKERYQEEKRQLLEQTVTKKILLYAPTFSPSHTSAIDLKAEIFKLANSENLLLIKFHDLMDKSIIRDYNKACSKNKNVEIVTDSNVIKYLLISDLMISDTSSVVYEFLLLDKPVITYKSSSQSIKWENITDPLKLESTVKDVLNLDEKQNERKWIIENYHPYNDGLSSKRMIDALELYTTENPIPEVRRIPWVRRYKMIKMFGKI